jgi:hypothetical protein
VKIYVKHAGTYIINTIYSVEKLYRKINKTLQENLVRDPEKLMKKIEKKQLEIKCRSAEVLPVKNLGVVLFNKVVYNNLVKANPCSIQFIMKEKPKKQSKEVLVSKEESKLDGLDLNLLGIPGVKNDKLQNLFNEMEKEQGKEKRKKENECTAKLMARNKKRRPKML